MLLLSQWITTSLSQPQHKHQNQLRQLHQQALQEASPVATQYQAQTALMLMPAWIIG